MKIDIAIIGGGPAGLSAALYCARGGADVVLFERMFPGGQAALTGQIENYPGFRDGIEGSALTTAMHEQAERFGAVTKYDEVTSVSFDDGNNTLTTTGGDVEAKSVIIALGATPRKLGLANEEKLTGRGVSYCAHCDGAFFKGKDVAVVGGGDTALSDAIYLARFANKVYLVHRRDAFRGTVALQNTVKELENIELVLDSIPAAILGDDAVRGLSVKNAKTGEERNIDIDGLFVAVGIIPQTDLVKEHVDCNEGGYIVVDNAMRTSKKGVFAAGDARNTLLRQVITAAADGAIAATMALEHLSE